MQSIFGGDANNAIVPKKEEASDADKDLISPTIRERPRDRKKKAPEKKYKYLDAYCENLSRKAEEGKIDRIIGRDGRSIAFCRSSTAAPKITPA